MDSTIYQRPINILFFMRSLLRLLISIYPFSSNMSLNKSGTIAATYQVGGQTLKAWLVSYGRRMGCSSMLQQYADSSGTSIVVRKNASL